jgi:hypothetical protein
LVRALCCSSCGEHETKLPALSACPFASCIVSISDSGRVKHSVEVTAESLYEAAALGLISYGSTRGSKRSGQRRD